MKNHKLYLQYSNACRLQDRIWFVDVEFNNLFSIDVRNLSVRFEGNIPFLDKSDQWAYSVNVNCCYGDTLFLFPSNGNYILVCDTRQGSIQGISIYPDNDSGKYVTAGIIQYDNYGLILPCKLTQGVFKLDFGALRLERSHELDKALESVEYIYNSGNVVRINSDEIAVLSGKDTIIGINLQEKKMVYCKRFDHIDIWGIRYDGVSFWLLTYNSTDVYEWIPDEDQVIRYCLLDEEWIHGKGLAYANMVFCGEHRLLLPCCLKNIMKIDKETHSISKSADYPIGFRFFDSFSMFSAFSSFHVLDGSRILLHPMRGNMFLIYDLDEDSIEGKQFVVSRGDIPCLKESYMQRFRQNNGIIRETDWFGVGMLDLFIDTGMAGEERGRDKQVGKSIYDICGT